MTTLKDYMVERTYVTQTVPVRPAAMAIGDLGSDAKGSGARANGGKPDLSLIPLGLLADALSGCNDTEEALRALRALGHFQATHKPSHLLDAMRELGLGDGLRECAQVFEYGKKKYAAWNWAKGMPWSVPLACAARHIVFGILQDEHLDPESGRPHRGHVFCNIVMLLQYTGTYTEGNDLPPVGLLGPA